MNIKRQIFYYFQTQKIQNIIERAKTI